MPSGHASHKGYSVKPNTNANDIIDTAADLNVEPEDFLGEGMDARRAENEAMVNPSATERPKDKPEARK